MATIIDTLKQETAAKSSEYLEQLRACGFPAPVADFPKITPEAIKQFLEPIARELAKTKKAWFPRFEVKDFSAWRIECGGGFSLEYQYGWSGISVSSVSWVEEKIEETRAFPPKHVLDSIQRAKPLFDYIRIVTVREVRDPLVVGINKGDRTRYLIDWWENDVDPSKIEMT